MVHAYEEVTRVVGHLVGSGAADRTPTLGSIGRTSGPRRGTNEEPKDEE